MSRAVVLAVAALLALTGQAPARAETADPCARESWVAGSVELCQGTLVYRDYVFDDYGAWHPVRTPSAPTTGVLSRPAGAERYPAGAEATADIVEVRLRIAGDELEATFLLNALHEPDQTTVTLAIDTDGADTGGGQWGALPVSSDGWDVLASFSDGDPDTNTITGRLPLPPGERWRVQASPGS